MNLNKLDSTHSVANGIIAGLSQLVDRHPDLKDFIPERTQNSKMLSLDPPNLPKNDQGKERFAQRILDDGYSP